MTSFIRRHLLVVSAAVVVLIGAAAWLTFGYFGVHTLFIDNEVDEALPTFGVPADASDDAAAATAPATAAPTTASSANPAPTEPVTSPSAPVDSVSADDASGGEGTGAAPGEVVTRAEGTFESIGRYRTVGTALVLGDGSDQRFLRFEDFETSNGPDLNVYLVNSSTGDVTDVVDLGDLRGNIGSQNYEIPADVDLSVYDTVMIWCVRFSTGFGQATLELA